MNTIQKTPIEIFGHDCSNGHLSEAAKISLKQQYCKYVHGTCLKPRKSTPKIKVGICTLGATVNKNPEIRPIIICPQRFKEETVFESIRLHYLKNWSNVKWVSEVKLGIAGSVDYVAIELDSNKTIKNFQCVEFQTAGTTGSPYPYIKDLQQYGDFHHAHHTYGINWANEFVKTMMQQAYKKGKIMEFWKRKIIFVLQDAAWEYISSSTDCSQVVGFNWDNPVDFCTFSLRYKNNNNLWKLEFNNIYSTTINGVSTIIGGAKVDEYPTENEFKDYILKKAIADKVIEI